MKNRIVRYGELRPCKTAFIDAHTPGSDQKENFTIIGGGVSESADQHVHIADTPGFNIGAAGQPPKCRNSLHVHTTAEVFFVLSGRWRFFWGRKGDAGEVILEEGDVINIPTGIFRGFENIGTDYAMIMAVLGGDDAGGGVDWAPQVITDAAEHGLVLGDNRCLYDTKKGQQLPAGVKPMPLMSDAELAGIPELSSSEVVSNYVARYQDLLALADKQPAKVIGADAVIRDRPGFDLELLGRDSMHASPYSLDEHEVLMVMRGHWRIQWASGTWHTASGEERWPEGEAVLAPGDTCAIPPGLEHSVTPAMSGEASLYRILSNQDPAGLTQKL